MIASDLVSYPVAKDLSEEDRSADPKDALMSEISWLLFWICIVLLLYLWIAKRNIPR